MSDCVQRGAGLAECLFGVELQGTFLTQAVLPSSSSSSSTSSSSSASSLSLSTKAIEYASIVIGSDEVSVWGRCHSRLPGNNFILEERSLYGEASSSCFRCFQLHSRSWSVLSVLTTHLNECFTRQTSAVASCPTRAEIEFGQAVSLLLFRSVSKPISCPIRGSFALKYRGGSSNLECNIDHSIEPESNLSNCPWASTLRLEFSRSQCNFETRSRLQCLAIWKAKGSESFVVFEQDHDQQHSTPRFRCGLLRREESTQDGRSLFTLSLSSDSTCSSDLYSASLGHETFSLQQLPPTPFPAIVRSGTCRFPRWVHGEWGDVHIEGGSMVHEASNKLVTTMCLQRAIGHRNRFLVYSRTPCGEDYYSCVWFESRDVNVLELQLGLRPATIPSNDLCDNERFLRRTWNTKAKTHPVMLSSCPIAGLYVGVIPDAPHLCSDIASDCSSPDVMSFVVYPCLNNSQILEKRVYRCLGVWEEEDKLFTYTRRLDLGYELHECFVGSVDTEDNSLVLMEAGGPDCTRGLNVLMLGMRLKERYTCPNVVAHNAPWLLPDVKIDFDQSFDVIHSIDGEHFDNFLDNVTNVQPMKGDASSLTTHFSRSLLVVCIHLLRSEALR